MSSTVLPHGHREPQLSQKTDGRQRRRNPNITRMAFNHPGEKLVYVSPPCHPRQPHGTKIKEVYKFDPCDPVGGGRLLPE